MGIPWFTRKAAWAIELLKALIVIITWSNRSHEIILLEQSLSVHSIPICQNHLLQGGKPTTLLVWKTTLALQHHFLIGQNYPVDRRNSCLLFHQVWYVTLQLVLRILDLRRSSRTRNIWILPEWMHALQLANLRKTTSFFRQGKYV